MRLEVLMEKRNRKRKSILLVLLMFTCLIWNSTLSVKAENEKKIGESYLTHEVEAVGTMFLITRIWDSVFDPIVGVAADRTQTRWGKFRPYLLWLAIPFAAIGVLTFMTPSFGQTGNLIYAYITYNLMMKV